jgi:hypothetical protein
LCWDGFSGTAAGLIRKNDFHQEYDLRFGKVALETGSLIWAACL